jgi:hypothetical protein
MRSLLLATVAIATFGFAGSAFAGSDTFTVTATTEAALTVTCGADLAFGVAAVEPSNAAATITVAASSGATASSSDASVHALGTSHPAACTVANETGGAATASLAGSTGTFSGTTLTGDTLTDVGLDTLSADLNVNKATAIGNETLYIGGVLSIPSAHTAFEAYSDTITLTVTD